jgi:L-lactate dehydrogenase complex protein LldG
MSTKDEILSRIRENTGRRYEMPDLTLDAITYEDRVSTFADNLKAAGGEAVVLQPGEDVNAVIRRAFPKVRRVASNLAGITCATFNPDDLDDPRELNGTDLSVVRASFGVAENGAVWLPLNVRFKAVYFISEALVILLDRRELVNNMNEAYRRTAATEYSYGTFMAGPSKTADIEQALVFGAHGPMRVMVILE